GSTAGCLVQLEKIVGPGAPASAIDLGTGSGILAIAAARLGVARVLAVDEDPDAVGAACANAAVNGVTRQVTCRVADAAGVTGERVAFDDEESRHMTAVLRLVPGDLVIAGDGRGSDYTVRLETLDATATGTIVGVAASRAESPVVVTLVQGIPKGDKMEQIVRAATELGVARVLPVITERTIVRLEPSRWRERARRWQRVAKEAS